MSELPIGPSQDLMFMDRMATIRVEHDDQASTLRIHADRLHACGTEVLAALSRELAQSEAADEAALAGAAQVLFGLARAFSQTAELVENNALVDDAEAQP